MSQSVNDENRVINALSGAAVGFFTGLRTGNPVAAVVSGGVGLVLGAAGHDVSEKITEIFDR